MSAASQPPLLDVRGFGLEFRTRGGTVRAGDPITVVLPPPPHRYLAPV